MTPRIEMSDPVKIETYPFRHFVKDGLWDEDLLDEVIAEIPSPDRSEWRKYDNEFEGKFEGGPSLWSEKTRDLLDLMADQANELADMFGMPELHMRTMGGGYHVIPPGGKLGIHADFNRSEDGLYRRLNMLVYLNRDWTEADGGLLELWDDKGCAKSVLPIFNRTVVFETSSTSFHGHPVPLPGPRHRMSIAAYFFSEEPGREFSNPHDTVWRNP